MNGVLYGLVISVGIALFRAMYETAIAQQVLALHQSKKLDESARLAIADLGGNRLYRTPCNQQLYSFHQPHLPSPKPETRSNFSAESPLDCSDAYTDFATERIQRWSIRLVCDEGFSDSKGS